MVALTLRSALGIAVRDEVACVEKPLQVGRGVHGGSHVDKKQQLPGSRNIGERLLGQMWGKVLREKYKYDLGGVLK